MLTDYGYGGGGGGNYTTTSYAAQGGAGDGGFMAGGSQENAATTRVQPSSTSKAAPVSAAIGSRKANHTAPRQQNYVDDSIRPVTIKQLTSAEHQPAMDKVVIDNAEVSQVTFVGQIRAVVPHPTNLMYRIEDGTGTVEVKQWIDPDFEARQQEQQANGMDGVMKMTATSPSNPKNLTEQTYVRAYGSLKEVANKRYVQARPSAVRAILDMNEVQYHLLEASVVHLHYTKGPLQALQQNKANANGAAGADGTNDVAMGGMGGAGGGPNMRKLAGMSAAARKVYNTLQNSPQTNEGLHMHDIAAQLGMNVGVIEGAGGELLNEGLVYTTVDEQTWAILDDM